MLKINKYLKILILVLLTILLFSLPVSQQEVTILNDYEYGNIKNVYLIEDNNQPYKLLQIISVKGYHEQIIMFLALDMTKGKIDVLDIIQENESLDYGGYISEEWFLSRFKGKDIDLKLKLVKMSAKEPQEVVAVTGATISSRAVVDGVNEALENYKEIRDSLNN